MMMHTRCIMLLICSHSLELIITLSISLFLSIFRILSGLEPIPAVRELKVGYAQDMFVTELTEKQKTIDSNIHTYRL